jgi:hypothetical protein
MKLHDLLKLFAVRLQEIEHITFDLVTYRSISNAYGQQLDNIGDTIGELRKGRNDDVYRIAIQIRIGLNMSSGEPETVIAVAKSASGAITIQYSEIYPAKVYLFLSGGTPYLGIKNIIQSVLPAGVGLDITYITSGLPFVFAGDNDGLGFGEIDHPDDGGMFAEHLT